MMISQYGSLNRGGSIAVIFSMYGGKTIREEEKSFSRGGQNNYSKNVLLIENIIFELFYGAKIPIMIKLPNINIMPIRLHGILVSLYFFLERNPLFLLAFQTPFSFSTYCTSILYAYALKIC